MSLKDDFYSFINKKWLSKTEIPNNKSSINQFDYLNDINIEKIKQLLSKLDKSNILYQYYNAGLLIVNDKSARNNLQNIINYISSTNRENIYDCLSTLTKLNISHFFDIDIDADIDAKKNRYIIYLSEGKLSLPTKDYYFNENLKNILEEYIKYMNKCNKYLNIDIGNVLKLEKKIAEQTNQPEINRNIDNIYNITNSNELPSNVYKTLITIFGDKSLFKEVIVTNPKYLSFINNIIDTTPINILKDYLIWRTFNSCIFFLDSELVSLYNSFYNKILNNKMEELPREQVVINILSYKLDDYLGYIYGSQYYTEEIKNKIIEMIRNIKESIIDILEKSWLSEKTKEESIIKINKMKFKIGYPKLSEITNYSKLELHGNFFIQTLLINLYLFNDSRKKIFTKVNPNLWDMGAHQVNAYYNPSLNEFVLPVGILQYPFFDIKKLDSFNYGRIGTIIGHEISHGFDDEGRKFDANGNIIIWWNKTEIDEYNKRSLKFVDQFNKVNVNGNLTLGENIADLYGVISSMNALKYKTNNPNLKFFFKSYAKLWRYKIKENEEKKRLLTDEHSPGKCRVNEILKNIDDFISIYDIKKGDKMYLPPDERLKLY